MQAGVEGGDVGGEHLVVHLGALGQVGDHHRDADAAADVAHQAEQRRPLVAITRRQGREGDGGERHEDEAEPQPLDDAGAHYVPAADVRVEQGHLPHGEAGEQQPREDEIAGIHPTGQAPHQHHGEHGADPARGEQIAHVDHRVPHQSLHEGGQQGHGREQYDADDEDKHQADAEVAITEQGRLDVGVRVGEDMHHEEVERHHHQGGLDDDLPAREPVLGFSPIQRHLQRTDAETQQGEAQQIEATAGIDLRLLDEGGEPEPGQQTERQVDVEDPAPVVVLGEPAPSDGPRMGPTMTPMPQSAMAEPCFSGG